MRDLGSMIAKTIKNTEKEHLILELLNMQQHGFEHIPCKVVGNSITFQLKGLAELLLPYMNTVLSKMNVAFNGDSVTLTVDMKKEEPVNVAKKHNCTCNAEADEAPANKRVTKLFYDEDSGDISYTITESSEIPTEDSKTVESKYLDMLREKLDALAEGFNVPWRSIADSMKKYLGVKGYDGKEIPDSQYSFDDLFEEVADLVYSSEDGSEDESAFVRDLKAYAKGGLTRREMMLSVFQFVVDVQGSHVDILTDTSTHEITAVCSSSEAKEKLVKAVQSAVKEAKAEGKLKVDQVNNKVTITVED